MTKSVKYTSLAVALIGTVAGIALILLGAVLLIFSHQSYLWIGLGSVALIAGVCIVVLYVSIAELLRVVGEIRKKVE